MLDQLFCLKNYLKSLTFSSVFSQISLAILQSPHQHAHVTSASVELVLTLRCSALMFDVVVGGQGLLRGTTLAAKGGVGGWVEGTRKIGCDACLNLMSEPQEILPGALFCMLFVDERAFIVQSFYAVKRNILVKIPSGIYNM